MKFETNQNTLIFNIRRKQLKTQRSLAAGGIRIATQTILTLLLRMLLFKMNLNSNMRAWFDWWLASNRKTWNSNDEIRDKSEYFNIQYSNLDIVSNFEVKLFEFNPLCNMVLRLALWVMRYHCGNKVATMCYLILDV